MANTKISQLTENTNPTGGEELVYAYNNANGKMSLNTMKTFVQNNLSGYATTADLATKQNTLVSGTNIRTINGASVMGSGDIIVTGGTGYTAGTGIDITGGVISATGGGGGSFDCVVDAAGGGDYTTINAALTAGENSIFVKNGTYNEGTQLLIKTPTVYIQGESSDGVIVNLEKSSTETTYLGYINFDSTDYTEDLIGVINNVTFNAIIGKGNQAYYFVLAETPSVHNNKNIAINNCYINFLGKAANTNIRMSQLTESEASSTHILSLNNCILVTDAHSSVTASDVSFRFYTAQEGRPTRNRKTISNDCRFIMRKTGFNNLFVMGTNNNCSFWIDGDNSEDITYMNIYGYNTGCWFDFSGYGTKLIRGILIGCTVGNYGSWKNNATQTAAVRSWVASGAAEREASHSYSVNDVVRYDGNIYICTEAHTSDSSGLDYSKFRVYMGYTYITRSARITNSLLNLGGDTIIEDEHDESPRDSDGIGFISNNEITVNTMGAGVPHIIAIGEERIIGNVITSTSNTTEIRLYVIDNCMVNSNSFNIGADGVVKGVGSNSLILGNIINTYTGTATCTVEAGHDNVADNNIISNKIF